MKLKDMILSIGIIASAYGCDMNESYAKKTSQYSCQCICPVDRTRSKVKQRPEVTCETVEQVINRILAKDRHYDKLIRKLVKRHPDIVVKYLPEKTKAKMGGVYIKSKVKKSYQKTSRGLRGLLEKGEKAVKKW